MAIEVTGEQYRDLDGKLWELKRQIRQKGGYPFDPGTLGEFLQRAIEGRFHEESIKILSITKSFNPVEFIGDDWKIDEADSDPQSFTLTEINPATFLFETCLNKGERSITGEEKLKRLKSKPNFVRFGANVFLALWLDWQANKENSVLEWLFRTKKIAYLDFFGTVFRDPSGDRYVRYLYRRGRGVWNWGCRWLNGVWRAAGLSAGCASSPRSLES